MLFKNKTFSTWAHDVLFKYYKLFKYFKLLLIQKYVIYIKRERFFIGETIKSILRKRWDWNWMGFGLGGKQKLFCSILKFLLNLIFVIFIFF